MDAPTRERIIDNCRPGWRIHVQTRLAHLHVFDREAPEVIVDLLDAPLLEAEHGARTLLRWMEDGFWSIAAGGGSAGEGSPATSTEPHLDIQLQVQGRVYTLQCRLTPSLQLRRIDA